jgi:hypothetical protein
MSDKNLPAVYSMSDLEKMAQQMVSSKLFGVENVSQAVTLMLVAQSEGLHPASAARDYHVIKGRPSMKADTMLARFQASGGIIEWQDYSDTKVAATFKHPNSPKPVLIEWTMEMAKRIGLAGKDNWRNYPRAMLRARVISEGVRTCYPVIATGIYTPEEVADFEKEKDITPTAGYFKALPGKRQDVVSETAAQVREYMDTDRPLDALQLVDDPGLDAEEKIALWSLLPSDHRSALKRLQDAEHARASGTISEPQRKRLEARISELGLDRERIKRYCADRYGVSHFAELAQDQYTELDAALEGIKAPGNESAGTQGNPSVSSPADASASPADLIDDVEEGRLLDLLNTEPVIELSRFLRATKFSGLRSIPKDQLQRCREWISRARSST